MKTEIHPPYYPKAKITCACGHVYTVGSTQKEMRVEICAHCHPFYTGQEKLLDVAGRVEKFRSRQEKAKTSKPKMESLGKRKAVTKVTQKTTVRLDKKTGKTLLGSPKRASKKRPAK